VIWTQLICSNFVTISLNTKQQIAQRIPLLGYIKVSFFWGGGELPDGFTGPFCRSGAVDCV